MENIINSIWGDTDHLNALQMASRAFVMFLIAFLLIRFVGTTRIFGKKSPFDQVIYIVLGSVFAKGIVGDTPFFSTIAAAIIMILMQRFMAWLSAKDDKICTLLKGKNILLYKDGKFLRRNMIKATISENDLMESLRLETKQTSLDKIEMAYLETNGRISFVTKKSE